MAHLKDIDLNLLTAFDAMMSERSVGRAALRLGIGQPAASHALARLRTLLDDELFRRDGRTMVPTERALEIAEPISRALAAAREALEPPASFDPSRSTRKFTLSGGDYALSVALPALLPLVRRHAPGIDLRFRFVEKDLALTLLDDGRLDLALSVYPNAPKRYEAVTVFEEHFVCVARRDHPAMANGLTLDGYASALHVLVTERGDERGAVDEALARVNRERRIALTVPSVLVLHRLLVETDLVATIGARVAQTFSQDPRLTMTSPPVATPVWRMQALRLRRSRPDPGLNWLIEQIVASQT